MNTKYKIEKYDLDPNLNLGLNPSKQHVDLLLLLPYLFSIELGLLLNLPELQNMF